MGSNGGTARERVESAARERGRVRVGAVGAMMVTPRLLCLLGAILASSTSAQKQGLPREAKQLSSQPEQKYDLELSFPVDSVLATNVNDDRRARIDNLIQEILLATQDDQVNSLPGTLLDPSSIVFEEGYRCEDGEVVIDQQCVPCPPGSYYDLAGGKKCTKCPIGHYNSESARLACNKCPIIQDKEGVTESEGATAVTECKEMCEAGHYLDQFTELCLPCGHGRYQENKGKFGCDLCEVGKTTRTKNALSKDECRDDCPDGQQLSFTGECETCPVGTYRTQGLHRGCQNCQSGRTSLRPGSTSEADCSVPVCVAGQFLNATDNQCQACPIGTFQPEEQQTQCIECPANTSTDDVGIVGNVGATSRKQCTNPCTKEQLCDKNAHCLFKPNLGQNIRRYQCSCKQGYKVNGKNCEEKSEFAYIAGGIAGAVLFIIVLVLLIWMICVRSGRGKRSLGQEKFAQPGADGVNGSQVNFYYGAPAPYAESIAPSQHGSTYAHYYEDEEDGWGMPNFYGTYGSLYNAGMYGPQYAPQGELYDRLGRHAYQPRPEDKSAGDTTSESEDDRRGSQ